MKNVNQRLLNSGLSLTIKLKIQSLVIRKTRPRRLAPRSFTKIQLKLAGKSEPKS